ncbi:MAG: FliM/FliN family flagellar motor switch protein [Pseudomonadota bacterium]
MSNTAERIELDEALSVDNNKAVPLLKRDMSLVKHVMVELTVDVGTAEMSVDALFALKTGDVVTLLQQVNEPMTLRLDGKAVARGSLVAVGDNFGIQIGDIL